MRLLIIKRSHKAKNVMKDQAELSEKPTGDLFKKESKKIYRRERSDQNKRPFSKGSSFSKQDGGGGGESQHLRKVPLPTAKYQSKQTIPWLENTTKR